MRKQTFLSCGIAGAVLALLAPCAPAAAEGCLDQVRSLAGRYDISTDPPSASPSNPPGASPGVTTQDLARSGGVIEPPAIEDKSVITPPRGQGNTMPTMPDVKPPPPKESGKSGPPPAKQPDLTALQALLVAARAQAERGSESECLEGLEKARQLIARTDK
jgi:hypothetical protein